MRKYINKIAILLAVIGTLILFMVFSLFVPQSLITENVKESVALIEHEGMYPSFIQSINSKGIIESRPRNNQINFYDNWSDATFLNIAYTRTETGPLKMAMANYYNHDETDEDFPALSGLQKAIEGEKVAIGEIGRYWIGIIPVLRILLIVFNLGEIRLLLFVTGIVLFLYTYVAMKDRLGIKIANSFAIAYVLCGGIINITCLAFSTDHILMLSMCLLLLKKTEIKEEWFYWVLVGMLTFLLNFWSMPLITLGIPLVIKCLLLIKEKTEEKNIFKKTFINSAIWLVGIVSAIVVKQVICFLLFKSVAGVNQAKHWGGDTLDIVGRLKLVLWCVEGLLLEKMTFIAGITLLIIIVASLIKNRINPLRLHAGQRTLLFISIYPIAWYFVTAAHTVHGFDKLMLMVSIFSLLSFASIYTEREAVKSDIRASNSKHGFFKRPAIVSTAKLGRTE
ncbi:MAG: hypothetical protein QM697_00170 [Lachnospiraceae bacterium]